MTNKLSATRLDWDAIPVIDLEVCIEKGNPPRYEEVLAGEYLIARLDEIYG